MTGIEDGVKMTKKRISYKTLLRETEDLIRFRDKYIYKLEAKIWRLEKAIAALEREE